MDLHAGSAYVHVPNYGWLKRGSGDVEKMPFNTVLATLLLIPMTERLFLGFVSLMPS